MSRRAHKRFMGSPPMQALRRRLYRRQRGRCHWCGCQMTPPGVTYTQAADRWAIATLDHLYPQGDLRRYLRQGRRPMVLACHRCNSNRNVVFQCVRSNATAALLAPPIDLRDLLTNTTNHP